MVSSTETSMHWKCQVIAAARSTSIYSKLNIRQKSQNWLPLIHYMSFFHSEILSASLFLLCNAEASWSRSESLCGSLETVPIWKVSIKNQPLLPLPLPTITAENFLRCGAVCLHSAFSANQPISVSLSLPSSPSPYQNWDTHSAKMWGKQWERVEKGGLW